MWAGSSNRFWPRLALFSVPLGLLWAQEAGRELAAEPEVVSIYPLGGERGATFNAEIRGNTLDGAYAVWFDGDGLGAQIRQIEAIQPSPAAKKGGPRQAALVQVTIDRAARIGLHHLRLVSPRGVSNSLAFRVGSDPVVRETDTPNHKPSLAQRVPIPVAVQGKMSKDGELDYYELEAGQDQELTFEVISGGGFDPQLALYEPDGSWFDSHRATRLAFNDEPVSNFTSTNPRLTYRFRKAGLYLVEVGAFLGNASAESPYQLRIGPAAVSNQTATSDWRERAFNRELGVSWIEALWSRTLKTRTPTREQVAGKGEASTFEGSVAAPVDRGNTDLPAPALMEGRIERPGQVAHFKFTVQAGQRLAFEIETPNAPPPLFNPHLIVLDETGLELFTNVYKRIVRNDTFYQKTLERKTVYTFERAGEFTLQIRDITSRAAGSNFAYRVLIRPQIPHVGELRLLEHARVALDGAIGKLSDHVNLKVGEAKKLSVTTAQEEGFAGEIAITAEGLPEGVRLLPATEVKPDAGPHRDEGQKERYVPKTEKATLILVAAANAPLTRMPQLIRVLAHAVVEGKLGPALLAGEIPLMVVPR